ncbi:uncharacterized protein LOC144105094 [Amblyomma americanum]
MPQISPEDEAGPSGVPTRKASVDESDSREATSSPVVSGCGAEEDMPSDRSEATSASEKLERSPGEYISGSSPSEPEMDVDTSQRTQTSSNPEVLGPVEMHPDPCAATPSSGSPSGTGRQAH